MQFMVSLHISRDADPVELKNIYGKNTNILWENSVTHYQKQQSSTTFIAMLLSKYVFLTYRAIWL